MSRRSRFAFLMAICAVLLGGTRARAQQREEPGKSIGRASAAGNLILLELDEGALGRQNLISISIPGAVSK